MGRTSKKTGIETQLRALEDIVKKLEDGSLPLEESLVLFEQGISLSRDLQSSLRAASMKVTRLLEGEPLLEEPLAEARPGDREGESS
jgi:exodeoxyribonuclease VII small subunit